MSGDGESVRLHAHAHARERAGVRASEGEKVRWDPASEGDTQGPGARRMRAPSECVAAAQAGDREAMRRLVLIWQPRVRNLVRYLVRGDDQVDDLAQQALITALEKLPSYRGEGAIEAWLDGIVLRVTLRAMRRFRLLRAREVKHSDETSPGGAWGAPRYSERRKLVRALDQVPHKQRSALVMHHVLGMSAREIATFERIPEETARSRLKHGIALLRLAFGVRTEEER